MLIVGMFFVVNRPIRYLIIECFKSTYVYLNTFNILR
jgi:hypothetical protein